MIYKIGKWVSEYVTCNTLRKLKPTFPNLEQKTVLSIIQKFEEPSRNLNQKRNPIRSLTPANIYLLKVIPRKTFNGDKLT